MESIAIIWPTLVAGAFGAAVGSFLNVIILRTYSGGKFWRGRSACPRCKKALSWFELVPVLSFIFLRGRCRKCRKLISLQYLVVECLTAALFMTVWLRYGWSLLMPLGWIIGAAMILVAIYDARWKMIPDSFTILFVVAAAVWALGTRAGWFETIVGALGGVAFFGLQYVLSRGKWVGSGDIFVALGLGILLGWHNLLLALVLAYLTGAIVAAVMILRRRTDAKATVAFGPYLMLAGFVAWLWAPAIIQWYLLYALPF